MTISSRTQPAKGVRKTGAKEDRTHENFLVRGKQVQWLGQASSPARGHGPVIHPKDLKHHCHLKLGSAQSHKKACHWRRVTPRKMESDKTVSFIFLIVVTKHLTQGP